MNDQFDMLRETELAPRVTPVARIIAGLREQQTRVIANWAVRVSTLPVFRASPGLGLDDIQRDIPALLDAALAAVEVGDHAVDDLPLEQASTLAARHAAARHAHGFGLPVVLAEMHALRQETWSALWRMMERAPNLLGSLREVERRLSETFDSLAIAAAEGWSSAGICD